MLYLLDTFVRHVPVPHTWHVELPGFPSSSTGLEAWPSLDSRWPACRPPTVGTVCAAFPGPQWRRPGRTSNTSDSDGLRPTAHEARSMSSIPCRARRPGERGRRPAPGAGAALSGRVGGRGVRARPSVRAITPRSSRRPSAGGDARLALVRLPEGCCCGDSGGLRGSGGTTSPGPSGEGAWSSGVSEGGEDAGWQCPRFPGRTSAAHSFSSISRTWTVRACGWGFCCPWWPPWISSTTTRKGWRRS